MVTPFLKSKEKTKNTNASSLNMMSREIVPVDNGHHDLRCHILYPNLELNGNKQLNCHLCKLIYGKTKKRRFIYGCIQCSKGFHVSCFATFHRRYELVGRTARIRNIINAAETVHETKETQGKGGVTKLVP